MTNGSRKWPVALETAQLPRFVVIYFGGEGEVVWEKLGSALYDIRGGTRSPITFTAASVYDAKAAISARVAYRLHQFGITIKEAARMDPEALLDKTSGFPITETRTPHTPTLPD